MAEIEDETELENSSSFWTSFTSRIGEMRLELRTLHPDVVGDAEKLQKIKLQLSGLQICKFLKKIGYLGRYHPACILFVCCYCTVEAYMKRTLI